ncbi:MAG: ribosome biogenesis GTPase Der [Phycisphaerales bacterium]|nr:MAG: ribosome biogenesis GTPase Der [Phycisphaerales bacterium]
MRTPLMGAGPPVRSPTIRTMSMSRIAIVGRPNVGKSSLLNLLAKAKVSIVDPTPGVTRDRVSVVVELDSPDGSGDPRMVEVTDTGGYGVYIADGRVQDDVGADLTRLTGPIERQIASAINDADLVLFVVDAQAGIVAADEEVARLLRQGGLGDNAASKVVVVANKVDGQGWESHAIDAARLGFGEPMMISAKSNYLRRDFIDKLFEMLPEATEEEARPDDELRVAIVGKRNAGKSTLVNALAGEERVIVSEIAGTTRDAIDVRFERDGKAFVAIDTAGVRKRKSMQDQVEWWAYDRARRAIRRADVVLFIVDASEPISQVDKQLTQEVQKTFKPCVVVVNKWDVARGRVVKGKPVTTETYRDYIDKELKGLANSPLVFTSALEGAKKGRVWGAIDVAFDLRAQARTRVGTGELNRVLQRVVDQGPSSKLGRRLRLLYATQVSVEPPTIVLVVNKPELFSPERERFILNRIREETAFEEVPVRLIVRGRRRDEEAFDADAPDARPAKKAAVRRVEGVSDEEYESFGELEDFDDIEPIDDLDDLDDDIGDESEDERIDEAGEEKDAPAPPPTERPTRRG